MEEGERGIDTRKGREGTRENEVEAGSSEIELCEKKMGCRAAVKEGQGRGEAGTGAGEEP